MDTTRYKIWQWLPPTGDGSNVQFNVAVLTKAKRSNTNPYEVANELLCLRLGLAMGLPIPLGMILERDHEVYYASLHVAVAGEKLPPATEDDLDAIAANESLACGIVMFDSWILNEDRHVGNISYIDETRSTYLIDHGRAFLDRTGRSYLQSQQDNLAIGDHCLADRITSLWAFDEWHKTMMGIPATFIKQSVSLAATIGLPESDVGFCTQYLLDRRERLPWIFSEHHKTAFPNLNEGLLDPLAGIPVEYQI
jgi:hypothetical protein